MAISKSEENMFKLWAKSVLKGGYNESMDVDESLKLFFQEPDLPDSLVREIKLGVYSRIAIYVILLFDEQTKSCGSVDELVASSFLEFNKKIKEFLVDYSGFFNKIQEIQNELVKISTSQLAKLIKEFDSEVENTLTNIIDFFKFYGELRKLITALEENHRSLYTKLKFVEGKFSQMDESDLLLNELGNSLERILNNLNDQYT